MIALATILNNWRLILIAAATTAFAVLIALFKHRGKKIKELQHEVKIKDTKAEITKIQSEQKKTALEDERKTIEELTLDVKESRHNDVNSL